MPITVVVRSKARNIFAHSNTGMVLSNPTGGMVVCLLSSMLKVSCVDNGLATGWSSLLGVQPTVYNIHNFRITYEWEQVREPNHSK
jgi:hypothetical protein